MRIKGVYERQLRARLIAILMLFGALFTLNGWGQADRGTISGTVVDPTGLAVSGVEISITESATGASYPGVITNDTGAYNIINLPLGKYSLLFQKQGFKQYNRNGVTVSVAQQAKVDIKLQVGGSSETVTVTANATVVDSTTATEATSLPGEDIQELPLSIAGGRNAMSFANMAVPTVAGGIVANSQTASMNLMVDGVDSDAGIQGTQAAPGVEAVQEVQVQTSGIDAESSQTGGGTVQYELKSGTNKLHGSLYTLATNEALDANTWTNNYWRGFCGSATGGGASAQCPSNYAQSYRRPNDRLKDWGFSAGGPIWKQHTFLFAAFERYSQNTMQWSPNGTTVPTTQMLTGDFSQLLTYSGIPSINPACTAGVPCPTGQYDASGNPIYYGAIFDPSNPGNVFPGNIIPDGRISAQSRSVLKIYQQDYAPTNDNLLNNYWGVGGDTNVVKNVDSKLDHHFSEKHYVNASINYSHTDYVSHGGHSGGSLFQYRNNTGGPFGDTGAQPYWFATIHLGDAYTFTPNLVNNLVFAFNWQEKRDATAAPAGKDFPGALSDFYPTLQYAGSMGIGESNVGQDIADMIRWQQMRTKDIVSWIHGRHIAKFGGEFISYNALGDFPAVEYTYKFSNLTGMPQALANNSGLNGNLGFGFANMELGQSTGANVNQLTENHGLQKAFNLLASDQIKVNRNMTVNIALRWDVNLKMHEKNGNWGNWVPTAQNKSWPGLVGAYEYLSNSSQSWMTDQDYHNFSPHVGFAYQLPHNLVVRGAWGLFYVPLGQNSWAGIPYGSVAGACYGCFGSNQTAPAASNVAAAFQWDQNVYPGIPSPATKDPNANLGGWGSDVWVTPDYLKLGKTQNFNLGVEYEINQNTVLDVRYMGNKGSNLHDGSLYPQNYPTWSQYEPLLKSGHAGDWIWSQDSAASAGVPWYPFLLNTIGGYGGYSASAAISPYPQVQAWGPIILAGYPHGSSGYNGLVTEIKKRAGHGLSLDLSYTYSHSVGNTQSFMSMWNGSNNATHGQNWAGNGGNMTDEWENSSEFQDPYSYSKFKGMVSPNDIRHWVKGYASYNLPFGRNGLWLQQSRVLNYFVGGWTLSPDLNYHSGQPMPAVHAQNGYPGWSQTFANLTNPSALHNHFKKLDLANLSDSNNRYFDPSAFHDQTLSTSDPQYGTFGNQQPYSSNWRGWAIYNEDLSIVKHFGFGNDERYKVSIRAEFYNVLNRHYWGAPSSSSTNSAYFGNVTYVTGNRTGQFGARFQW